MEYMIIVTPAPDEPKRVTRGQVLDALRWLVTRRDAGIIQANAWSTKGGYVILDAASADEAVAFFDDYGLRATIELEPHRVVSLEDGFAVLLADIEEIGRSNA